jgi:hypothetical protein
VDVDGDEAVPPPDAAFPLHPASSTPAITTQISLLTRQLVVSTSTSPKMSAVTSSAASSCFAP